MWQILYTIVKAIKDSGELYSTFTNSSKNRTLVYNYQRLYQNLLLIVSTGREIQKHIREIQRYIEDLELIDGRKYLRAEEFRLGYYKIVEQINNYRTSTGTLLTQQGENINDFYDILVNFSSDLDFFAPSIRNQIALLLNYKKGILRQLVFLLKTGYLPATISVISGRMVDYLIVRESESLPNTLSNETESLPIVTIDSGIHFDVGKADGFYQSMKIYLETNPEERINQIEYEAEQIRQMMLRQFSRDDNAWSLLEFQRNKNNNASKLD